MFVASDDWRPYFVAIAYFALDGNQGPNSQNILGQFYDILHTHANVLIHKTSYDNFTTKILRSL